MTLGIVSPPVGSRGHSRSPVQKTKYGPMTRAADESGQGTGLCFNFMPCDTV